MTTKRKKGIITSFAAILSHGDNGVKVRAARVESHDSGVANKDFVPDEMMGNFF